MKNTLPAFLVAALAVGANVQPIWAQTNPDSIDDEVVVTTTRAPTPKADNPGNIATLPPAVAIYPVELLNRAPGVHIHRGSGQEHLTAIRSPVLVGGAGAGSFLYLEDGISMRAPGFANVNALMDAMPSAASRVEVVRGPGSALYGSNALHGLINFVGGKIEAGDTRGALSYGSYDRYAVTGQVSYPGENFANRISYAFNGENSGFQESSGFDHRKARWEGQWGGGATDYHLSFSYMDLEQQTGGYVIAKDDLENPTNQDDVDELPAACRTIAGPAYQNADCAASNPNPNAYRNATAYRGYLRITRGFGGGSLTFTPYWRSNEMEFFMHFLPGTPTENNAHDSYGLQSAYRFERSWIALTLGLDYEQTVGTLHEEQTAMLTGFLASRYQPGVHYDFEVTAQVVAPYAHIVWGLGDRTDLITGIRAEQTTYDYTDNTGGGLSGFLFRPESQTNDFADVSPKLGLLHRLSQNHRLFINLARAARAPQVTDLYRLRDSNTNDDINPDVSDIESETLGSVELGYRISYPRFSYELTAFAMQKENYHFRDASDNYITNGATNHQGVEMDFLWRMGAQWELDASITYALHEYAFSNSNPSGIHITEIVTEGDQVDSAPQTLAQARLSYQPTDRFLLTLDWEHVGPYFIDASNSEEHKYDGHNLFDFGLSYRLAFNTQLTLKVQNLADTAYAKRADRWRGENRYFAGEPRHFALTIASNF